MIGTPKLSRTSTGLGPVVAALVVGLAGLGAGLTPALAEKPDSDSTSSSRPRATTQRALAIWGPGDTADGARLAHLALEQALAPATPFPSRVLDLSDWLGAARFRLGGSATTVPCAASPSGVEQEDATRSEIQALILTGRSQLDELEFETAAATFKTAALRIPCQEAFLPQEAFLEVSFYAGIAAFYLKDLEAARRHFVQAAAVDPSRPWDPSYPPEPQSTFLSAVQDVIASPKGRVFGDMRSTNYVEVWLDGRQLDLTKAIELSVQPGRHLVQALSQEGAWSTFVREVGEGATLTLFSDRGMEQMLLDGPDGVLERPAASTLRRRARAESLDEIYVVRLDPKGAQPPTVYSYAASPDRWSRHELQKESEAAAETTLSPTATGSEDDDASDSEANPLLREPDYRTGATFGFKALQILRCSDQDASSEGLCPNGTKQRSGYVGGLVGIDVRLVRGLNLDLRFGATVTDVILGGTLLPEFGFGLRYRFLTGNLQPYAGIAGDLYFGTVRIDPWSKQNRVVLYGGLLFFGGVDFEFPDGFRITVEGGAGPLIRPEGQDTTWPMGHFHVGIGRFMP